MKKKQSIERQESPHGPHDAASERAEEAAKAKSEELRAVLQSKSEQGQSTSVSLPALEEKRVESGEVANQSWLRLPIDSLSQVNW
jgi:hypothetical protein